MHVLVVRYTIYDTKTKSGWPREEWAWLAVFRIPQLSRHVLTPAIRRYIHVYGAFGVVWQGLCNFKRQDFVLHIRKFRLYSRCHSTYLRYVLNVVVRHYSLLLVYICMLIDFRCGYAVVKIIHCSYFIDRKTHLLHALCKGKLGPPKITTRWNWLFRTKSCRQNYETRDCSYMNSVFEFCCISFILHAALIYIVHVRTAGIYRTIALESHIFLLLLLQLSNSDRSILVIYAEV